MNIIEAIQHRQSIRAFLNKPVDQKILETILSAARYAPSGVNHQPWHVTVILQGEKRSALSDEIIQTRRSGVPENPDYHYYPSVWTEPYKARRVACGIAMYQALHIERNDTAKRQEVWERNYHFFDAPVGLIISLEGQLERGSWMDLGMFIQNILLAALEFNLGTCAQAALAEYPDIIRRHLHIPETQKIACGISLGYPDLEHPVNQYRTERIDLADFVRWM